jgi:hypothetical protein
VVVRRAGSVMVAEVRRLDRRSAGEIRSVEQQSQRHEDRESWGRVRYLGNVIHLAVTAERPDIAAHSAGELVSLATRRLRQLNDPDAA